MIMAQVAHADLGKPRLLCALFRMPSHLVVREREDVPVGSCPLRVHERAQFLFEKRRHLHDVPRYARLRGDHHIGAPDLRHTLPHHDDVAVEVDIVSHECGHLSRAKPAPVEDLEGAMRCRIVLHLLGGSQVLLLRPELHLFRASCSSCEVPSWCCARVRSGWRRGSVWHRAGC